MDTHVAGHSATAQAPAAASLPSLLAALGVDAEVDWLPEHLPDSAWHEHIPFAFWLVKALRPRSIVELGTHWGASYGAFCQAVDRLGLDTRAHAIDTWEGDPQAGTYGEEVFAGLSQLNDRRWRRFSRLLRGTFAQARPLFGPGQVDLLHIDGCHDHAAVAADFAAWRECVSSRGVVLFHDTTVRARGFGVWRLWAELAPRHPHFEFLHGHGLGVLGLGDQLPPALQALFRMAGNPAETAAIRGFFAARGEAVAGRAEQRRLAAEVARTVALADAAESCRAEAQTLRLRVEQLAAAEAARQQEAAVLRAHVETLRREAAALQAAEAARTAAEAEAAAARTEAERAAAALATAEALAALAERRARQLEAQQAALRGRSLAMASSTSWRVTLPLRVARRMARGDLSDLGRLRAAVARRLAQRLARFGRARAAGAPPLALAPPAPPPRWPAPRLDAVDIIVCVHNAPADTARCLAAVLAATLPPYRLILVDDGSAAETAGLLAGFARDHGALLVRHEAARGYTRAANAGLRASAAADPAPWVVLLNSDTIVTDGWLDRMVERAAADPRIGLLGPLSNTASWQSVPHLSEGADWEENPLPPGLDVAGMARLVAEAAGREAVELPFLNGFCLLVRRAVLDQVGLFDEARFGEGYGEENDYCVRARLAGWRLAVADDAFVWHAQSRSYSHERRRALAARADRALAARHDHATLILPQVEACRDSLAMAGLRARIATAIETREVTAAARLRHEGRRIAFLLPVAAEGGGGLVVIQEARALARMGVDAALINLAPCRPGFEASYPGLDLPVHWAADPAAARALAADPRLGFDAVVATAHHSFAWLPEGPKAPIPAYYIQDFEPWFFPPGHPDHAGALLTYLIRPEIRRICKTAWNAGAVAEAGGFRPTPIGASVDAGLFRPAPGPGAAPGGRGDAPVRIAAMVRPATPRRAPRRTAEVLQALRARFGGGVVLTAFGATDAELAEAGLDLRGIRNAGRLDRWMMAALLRETDVFLDLSDYQAMGLTALEAMASGCAVLVPERGGAVELTAGGEAALAVDTADPAAATAAAMRLVADAPFRARLRLAAAAEAPRHAPELAAARLLAAIFGPHPRADGTRDAAPAPAA